MTFHFLILYLLVIDEHQCRSNEWCWMWPVTCMYVRQDTVGIKGKPKNWTWSLVTTKLMGKQRLRRGTFLIWLGHGQLTSLLRPSNKWLVMSDRHTSMAVSYDEQSKHSYTHTLQHHFHPLVVLLTGGPSYISGTGEGVCDKIE